MRSNKIKVLCILVLALIAIAGCDGGKSKSPITDVDIRKGTDGIKMEFLPNAPPQNVFAEIGFTISLKLKNAGAFDVIENKETPEIEKGIIVFGFEKAYVDVAQDKFAELSVDELKTKNLDELRMLVPDFGLLSNEDLKKFSNENKEKYRQQLISLIENFKKGSIFEIKGKSIYAPLGDEEFITVNAMAGAIGPQSEKHPSTIFATACYPYETIFGASVCIDTDIIGESKGKVCTTKDLAFTEGQGAPVAVTKVETRMLPQENGKVKPHFLIYVKNAGNGQVINTSKIDRVCSSEPLNYKDFNTLKVNATLSGVELDCDPAIGMQKTAEVRLRDKEDLIRCTYDKDGGIDAGADAYVAPLRVELDYGYTFTISKNIIIEKVLTH